VRDTGVRVTALNYMTTHDTCADRDAVADVIVLHN
jgi:hypothetical protein